MIVKSASERPNILLIITDQHRADWLGCMGHPVLKTPNIDALANTGVVFDDFHVAAPVCMPNRASLMTGRMPSVHGLRTNGCLLPKRANTFVDVLAKAGYRTASIGKSHLQPFTGAPPQRAKDATPRLIEEAWTADGEDYQMEEPSRYAQGDVSFEEGYYGFQHVDMVTGHGDSCQGHYGQWFRNTHSDWERLHDPAHELPHDYTCPQAYRTPVAEENYPTTWIGDRAVSYLTDAATKDDPFFAFVSFPDPHHPFNPPGKYWDMYDPEDFSVDLPFEAHQNPPPSMAVLKKRLAQGIQPETPQSPFCATERQIQEAKALTAGMITMIDDQVGRLVQTLKDTGQFDNTVILFTSDHGDYLGDFNMMLKGAMPFRSITRVPMIWSDPKDPTARRSQELAQTIDISASLLDRVGLAPYFGMQGRRFLGALSGGAHRDRLLIEHNDGGPRMGFDPAARMRSLVTKEWRMTTYKGLDWGELYHLRDDPNETNNLWDAPGAASQKAALALDLIDALTAQMDESPRANRLA